ncbi:MAG: glutamate--cysteine ligase [Ilumatobacter sp.]|nr:MAG: glutamate--cysteine ligase [Ilumatobacter sp.]
MAIDFRRNDRPTVGVELELHLVDPETGELAPVASDILREMGAPFAPAEHPTAKHELFESTIEIITNICENPDAIHADLSATLDEVRRAAERRGCTLISAGTHPFGLAREQVVSPDPRYQELIETMQWPARRLLICGTHIHVGVRDGATAIAVINEIRRHLPLFLALSASSPFFEGEDSGLASARAKVFESLPTAGLPPMLTGWADFEMFMSTLLESECIASIREVWWDVRPHPNFGTVEFRMCDATQTLREATALAALAQALVRWCELRLVEGDLPDPPREWTVRENKWLAGRYGTEASLIVEHADTGHPERRPVAELVDELIEMLAPVVDELRTEPWMDEVRTILATGSGTARQRRLVEAGGTLPDVVRYLIRELAADAAIGG